MFTHEIANRSTGPYTLISSFYATSNVFQWDWPELTGDSRLTGNSDFSARLVPANRKGIVRSSAIASLISIL
jgi:hypothetical protein